MDVTTGIVKSKASVVNTLLNVVRTFYPSNSFSGDIANMPMLSSLRAPMAPGQAFWGV